MLCSTKLENPKSLLIQQLENISFSSLDFQPIWLLNVISCTYVVDCLLKINLC